MEASIPGKNTIKSVSFRFTLSRVIIVLQHSLWQLCMHVCSVFQVTTNPLRHRTKAMSIFEFTLVRISIVTFQMHQTHLDWPSAFVLL